MKTYQTGIIEDKTSSAIFMLFKLTGSGKLSDTLAKLSNKIDGSSAVAGFGNKLMKFFPKVSSYQQHKFNSPLLDNETCCDLAIWLKNNDKGKLFHQATEFRNMLSDSFELQNVVSAYSYREKFDLSDFEDAIENPEGNAMLPVAIAEDGSSFWVLQQWLHTTIKDTVPSDFLVNNPSVIVQHTSPATHKFDDFNLKFGLKEFLRAKGLSLEQMKRAKTYVDLALQENGL
jgi:deferrochelatase/peroxidase EfeB